MISITGETTVNVPAKDVFNFLVNIDSLYKIWHPKDHVFCKVLSGSLAKKGGRFHFLEIIGGFPLYLTARITDVRENEYLEYVPAFPFSLLKTGKAYFRVERISENQSKLTAYVEYGGKLMDGIANFLVKTSSAKKHIKEEGENLKRYLEQKEFAATSFATSFAQGYRRLKKATECKAKRYENWSVCSCNCEEMY